MAETYRSIDPVAGERANRYKRTLLGLAVVVIFVILNDIPVAEASLLGIKPGEKIWQLGFLVFIYNALKFGIEIHGDYRRWLDKVFEISSTNSLDAGEFLPRLLFRVPRLSLRRPNILFTHPGLVFRDPGILLRSVDFTFRRIYRDKSTGRTFDSVKDKSQGIMKIRHLRDDGNVNMEITAISFKEVKHLQIVFLSFWGFDIVLPIGASFWAAYLTYPHWAYIISWLNRSWGPML